MEAQPIGPELLEAELTVMPEGGVLPEMSEVHHQCIYIVPPRLRQVNPKAYTPQVVSIGPFHNPRGSGEEKKMLKPMEELKQQYLRGFLRRAHLREQDILPRLEEWEQRIRSCYDGTIRYEERPIWMDDPLLSKPSLRHDIRQDLILLENQLPFFVLEDIYNLAGRRFLSFNHITFHYFRKFNWHNINPERGCPKHFTDLLRTLLLHSPFEFDFDFDLDLEQIENVTGQVYSASQLKGAGLVFKNSESTCLLDLVFEKGVLTMPCFHVHGSTETYLRNILAFEEYHRPHSAYVAEYLLILDHLINEEKDVSILVNKKIIVNLMGDAKSVATMFNNLCKDIALPGFSSKYISLCKSLNAFYENPCNKCKAMFIPEYFDTPVKIASSIAAMLLILLALIQTIFSVCSYFKEK